jgi:DNA polymerase
MSNKPGNIGNLVRRALMAQVEMGTDEVILTERQAKKEKKQRLVSTASVAAEDPPKEAAAPSEPVRTEKAMQATLDMRLQAEFESLEAHCRAVCECHLCPLGETRTKFVYGVGNPNADLLFIGEAPGADEDRIGEPFVGRAGQLLDKILEAMKLTRDQVYIANILKCRPPENRDPQPAEMEKCFPYLREQVRLIRPKVICALGRVSAQALLKTTTPLGKLRGHWHEYEGVPLRVTYHPAALLRFQSYKKPTWEDMQEIMARYDNLSGGL